MNRTVSKIASAITYLLFVLLIAVAVIGIVKWINNKIAFTVTYGDTVYSADSENKLILPLEGQAIFKVNNLTGYTVTVKPNVDRQNDVVYSVDGQTYNLSEEKNLTAIFFDTDDVKTEYFTLDCTKDLSLIGVLASVWNVGKDKIVCQNIVEYPFKIVVTATNGESIEIEITQTVFSIRLDPDNIAF